MRSYIAIWTTGEIPFPRNNSPSPQPSGEHGRRSRESSGALTVESRKNSGRKRSRGTRTTSGARSRARDSSGASARGRPAALAPQQPGERAETIHTRAHVHIHVPRIQVREGSGGGDHSQNLGDLPRCNWRTAGPNGLTVQPLIYLDAVGMRRRWCRRPMK